MKYGYIRNSPLDVDGSFQKRALRKMNMDHLVHEISFREDDQLEKLLEAATENDEVYVESFVHFSHSLAQFDYFLTKFSEKRISLNFIKEDISTREPLLLPLEKMVHLLSSFHSESISLATKAGLDEAKEQGKSSGRPRKKDSNVLRAIEMYHSGNYTLADIKEQTNISKSTLYRYLEK